MKRIIIVAILTLFSLYLFSQSVIEDVLIEIEKNNSTLVAIRSSSKAVKLENKTGNYLQNPEVEFHYLWGNPGSMGNRTDISIMQSFDFPSAYKYKNQISDIKNTQVDIEYSKQLRELMLKARVICMDVIFTNSLIEEYKRRQDHAESIATSVELKYDNGESNILEYNKTQLNLLNVSTQLETLRIERETLLMELMGLNGGTKINMDAKDFPIVDLPEDFDQWYTNAENSNPVLNWVKKEIELNQKQEKYFRAMSLPKIEAGYMSEKVIGEQFQGIIIGLSIPLWENKNTVKYAKENIVAFQDIAEDTKLQFYNHLKSLHQKSLGLQQNISTYREKLHIYSNSELLLKALNNGEVSIIEYIYETSIYYESIENLMEMELELNKTIAELNQYL
jgi:outer membrane protein, heavy metal efflux system